MKKKLEEISKELESLRKEISNLRRKLEELTSGLTELEEYAEEVIKKLGLEEAVNNKNNQRTEQKNRKLSRSTKSRRTGTRK